MPHDIYDPLEEFTNTFQPRFKEVSESTFGELAREAQVDVEANRETCRKIYANEEELDSVKAKGGWWKAVCIVLWILVAGGIVSIIMMHEEWSEETILAIALFLILTIAILLIRIHPLIKSINKDGAFFLQKELLFSDQQTLYREAPSRCQ